MSCSSRQNPTLTTVFLGQLSQQYGPKATSSLEKHSPRFGLISSGARYPKKSHSNRVTDRAMIYPFIVAHEGQFEIKIMCRVQAMSVSGYYAWGQRCPSRRAQENQALVAQIQNIHKQSRQTYGSRRLTAALRARVCLVIVNDSGISIFNRPSAIPTSPTKWRMLKFGPGDAKCVPNIIQFIFSAGVLLRLVFRSIGLDIPNSSRHVSIALYRSLSAPARRCSPFF